MSKTPNVKINDEFKPKLRVTVGKAPTDHSIGAVGIWRVREKVMKWLFGEVIENCIIYVGHQVNEIEVKKEDFPDFLE